MTPYFRPISRRVCVIKRKWIHHYTYKFCVVTTFSEHGVKTMGQEYQCHTLPKRYPYCHCLDLLLTRFLGAAGSSTEGTSGFAFAFALAPAAGAATGPSLREGPGRAFDLGCGIFKALARPSICKASMHLSYVCWKGCRGPHRFITSFCDKLSQPKRYQTFARDQRLADL